MNSKLAMLEETKAKMQNCYGEYMHAGMISAFHRDPKYREEEEIFYAYYELYKKIHEEISNIDYTEFYMYEKYYDYLLHVIVQQYENISKISVEIDIPEINLITFFIYIKKCLDKCPIWKISTQPHEYVFVKSIDDAHQLLYTSTDVSISITESSYDFYKEPMNRINDSTNMPNVISNLVASYYW
jgi:hypothetical protein